MTKDRCQKNFKILTSRLFTNIEKLYLKTHCRHMEQRLQWWAYVLMAIGIFLVFLALNYVVKIINDNRFEERMNRLYGKISTCTQVERPLIEIGTKSAAKNETPGGISLVFTKEDNKHRIIAPSSLDRITEEPKSTTANQLLGTVYNNKKFSSHGSLGRIQSEMAKPDDYARVPLFRLSLNRNVRMASSADSVGSTQGYKIKASNAVEDLKAQNVMTIEYTIHADNASESSLPKVPEHLFFDVAKSQSDDASLYTEHLSLYQESVSRITSKLQNDSIILTADDNSTVKAGRSDVAVFMDSNKTLLPEPESNVSIIFNPDDNIEVHCLGTIYHDTSLLIKDCNRSICKSNETKLDISSKSSVINVANAYRCSSKEIEKTSYSVITLCNDIVQGMLIKLDKSDEAADDDP